MDILWYYFYCSDDNRCLGEGAMFDYIKEVIYKSFYLLKFLKNISNIYF